MDRKTPIWDFEHSVECNASRAFAWAFWTDVSNWERLEGEAVESIRLDGPFEAGSQGVTKSPGQEPRHWSIADMEPEASATIEMSFDGATFLNHMVFETLDGNRTRITQRMSLLGDVPSDMLQGIKTFESTAPEGLARMASVIELAEQATDSDRNA